jgi:hypothetical protein
VAVAVRVRVRVTVRLAVSQPISYPLVPRALSLPLSRHRVLRQRLLLLMLVVLVSYWLRLCA